MKRLFLPMPGLPLMVLLLSVAGVACVGPPDATAEGAMAQHDQHRVPGEYLVTVRPAGGEPEVRSVFGQYAIKSVKSLGKGRFLVSVERDPGPRAMEEAARNASSIERVQPNFVYRAPAPMRPAIRLDK